MKSFLGGTEEKRWNTVQHASVGLKRVAARPSIYPSTCVANIEHQEIGGEDALDVKGRDVQT